MIEVSSAMCRVRVDGRCLLCGMRGSLSAEDTGFTNVVAVGDRVVVSDDGAEQGVVEAVLPRKSVLARPDVFYGHLQQVIVANADQLLVVAAWQDPPLWMELIDRYLIAAERHNLLPLICINKVDLAADIAQCRTRMKPYLALGYQMFFTSVVTGEGVERLSAALRGKISVLAGMSGVGKSSLLMAIQPGLDLRVSRVSDFGEGRHTTTQVNLLELEIDGDAMRCSVPPTRCSVPPTYVVDTPGIREFGLSGLKRPELVRFYPDIAAVQSKCRFADCSHTHEPGCAVKAAVHNGRVSPDRLHSYRVIYQSLPA